MKENKEARHTCEFFCKISEKLKRQRNVKTSKYTKFRIFKSTEKLKSNDNKQRKEWKLLTKVIQQHKKQKRLETLNKSHTTTTTKTKAEATTANTGKELTVLGTVATAASSFKFRFALIVPAILLISVTYRQKSCILVLT